MPVGEKTVTRQVGGKDVVFRKLSVYDRAGILRRMKARDRAELLANLNEVGADKGEKIAELDRLAREEYGAQRFSDYAIGAEGSVEVLELALSETAEAERKGVIESMVLSSAETFDLICELCNFERAEPAAADDDSGYGDGEQPDPTPPA